MYISLLAAGVGWETRRPPNGKGDPVLIDEFGRRFQYLRLSLTEKCNFSCTYCLPNGYQGGAQKFLSQDEVVKLATAFAKLGTKKIRLTGGEPTLRPDLLSIISSLKEVSGIEKVALTTNAYRLPQMLRALRVAGLDSLNVSLDSLRADRFLKICGMDYCESIKASVDEALALGFHSVKLNVVLMKDINDDEFFDFVEWVRERPVAVRFIELMRTNDNHEFYRKHHLSTSEFVSRLSQHSWIQGARAADAGPATHFSHPEYQGQIGFIAPYSKDFCQSCNRLRVSAQGRLRLCLFGDGEGSLKHLLQDWSQQDELCEQICAYLKVKTSGHRLHEQISGTMGSLSAIGG